MSNIFPEDPAEAIMASEIQRQAIGVAGNPRRARGAGRRTTERTSNSVRETAWREGGEAETVEVPTETTEVVREPLAEHLVVERVPPINTTASYRWIKRAMDIVGAAVGLLLTAPIMALCAVMIKAHDGGPILFSQIRVGEKGRHFHILKFRSMVVHADAMKQLLMDKNEHGDARTFKILNDPRITKVGRFMRRLSFDELPQFWNVLMGDMSLVGPRPALPSEVALYEDHDYLRLAVPPGLTCIWQVSGRSRLDFRQQMRLDLEYIDRRGVLTDLSLIARTLPAVFRGDGAA